MLRRCVILLGIGLLGLLSAGCGDTTNSGSGELSFREQIAQAKREADPELRAKQLIRIGCQQGKAQDMAGAEETLRLAWKDCDSIADPAAKAGALVLMAKANATLDNRPAAKRAADEALDAAAKIESAESKATTLALVAQGQGGRTIPTLPRPRSSRPRRPPARSETPSTRRRRCAPLPRRSRRSKSRPSAIACSRPL